MTLPIGLPQPTTLQRSRSLFNLDVDVLNEEGNAVSDCGRHFTCVCKAIIANPSCRNGANTLRFLCGGMVRVCGYLLMIISLLDMYPFR